MFYVYVYRKKLQDFDKVRKVLFMYGPYRTKTTAKFALRRRGWKEEGNSGTWFSASSLENGSFALIRVARSGIGLKSWRKWKWK
ncbi:MAG: hypothetical protein A2V69_01945 [Candidatus Portnoybacteria bacterium RBG_13_40_8]|uniref:Uncharacterized protein n=1 Tax=Candidatus Portnoybacteria bacterium RBG_13_40_8 TaxID=1801990 RepID=A0A1G2F5L6_9BACT|nr:MAG: hypothetical protein A2V69_01945 [Candidatus Portnoybacteria bacterium RBG_13_40_8]